MAVYTTLCGAYVSGGFNERSISAVFNLLGSVVVGWLTIRARVFPAAVGWLLAVGGVLNLLGGLTPAGLFTSVLGIVSGLAGAIAMAGYGWTIVGSTRQHSQAG